MSDHWDFYMCQIDGQPVSIFVDLGLKPEVPLRGFGHVTRLQVTMKQPRPDGLSSADEFEALCAVEDAVVDALKGDASPLQFVGRTTGHGTRDFYIYNADPTHCERIVAEAMGAFPDYQFDAASRPDPNWEAFQNFLYPSAREQETIQNNRHMENLRNQGDHPEVVRQVCHWAQFSKPQDREHFAEAVAALGYEEITRQEEVGSERPHKITIAHRTDLVPESIHAATLKLYDLALAHGKGQYGGWDTSVES